MYRPEGTQLTWHDCTREQARGVLMRHGISGTLMTQAKNRLHDPEWSHGPSVYVIDTLTNKGARVTIQGPETYDVKVSRHTGEDLLATLCRMAAYPEIIDNLVIID